MSTPNGKTGKIYLIPTTLGDMPPLEVLPISIKQTIEKLDHYVVENEKTARRFIKKISPRKSQPSLKLFVLNKFTEAAEIPNFLNPCLEGLDVGILSEAGCPGIADPGAAVVKIAHDKNIQVVPLVGPSSILLALMASGMNGQNFAFNGYLPIDSADRKKYIKNLERRSKDENQSQVFIETPYRNNKMLEELIKTLAPSTRVCVAADITLPTEYIKTKTAINWKRENVDLHKRPAIFIIQA
ncbi:MULTISPECIES: SAM-dependent methyltransferase [Maribacter]|uniref:SAM-dependent methyltransferase n=1 Tax=Maribacter TaxID=252356 RepID=UPI0023EDB47C|nr:MULTISPECIES: SAM-dependent methyltransferase [Maribacter]MDF4222053.1 SAM-dependent methyltransferase [Maribacter huludaoensis]